MRRLLARRSRSRPRLLRSVYQVLDEARVRKATEMAHKNGWIASDATLNPLTFEQLSQLSLTECARMIAERGFLYREIEDYVPPADLPSAAKPAEAPKPANVGDGMLLVPTTHTECWHTFRHGSWNAVDSAWLGSSPQQSTHHPESHHHCHSCARRQGR